MKNRRKYTLGLILLSIALMITLIATFIPFSRTEKIIDFTLINPEIPDSNLPVDLPIYLLEELRVLKLSYPQQIWLGDLQFITLSIIPKANNSVQKTTKSSQERYVAYLETRLEMGSVQVLTGNSVVEAIKENQSAQFLWQVKSLISGKTNGILWVFVNIADSQIGGTWQLTRFALPISIEVKDIFGMSLSSARILTLVGLGIVVSVLMILKFIIPQKK